MTTCVLCGQNAMLVDGRLSQHYRSLTERPLVLCLGGGLKG